MVKVDSTVVVSPKRSWLFPPSLLLPDIPIRATIKLGVKGPLDTGKVRETQLAVPCRAVLCCVVQCGAVCHWHCVAAGSSNVLTCTILTANALHAGVATSVYLLVRALCGVMQFAVSSSSRSPWAARQQTALSGMRFFVCRSSFWTAAGTTCPAPPASSAASTVS
jgi:hypothetical protein